MRGTEIVAFLVILGVALALPQAFSAYETNRASVLLIHTLVGQARDMIIHPLLLDPKAGVINNPTNRPALDRVIRWTDSALARTQGNTGAWFIEGIADLALGDFRAAEHALKTAIPDRSALAGVWLGIVYEAQGELDSAIKVWRDTGAAGFLVVRSRLYAGMAKRAERKGDLDRAISAYQQAIKWRPKYAGYRASLALLYKRKGWYEQAREQLKIAVERDPDNALYRIWLGGIYRDLGQMDAAEEQFRMAATMARTGYRALAYSELGRAYLSQRRYNEAVSVLEESVSLAPGHIPYRVWLAQAYYATNRMEEAKSQLLEAVKSSQTHKGWRAWAYAELGKLYEEQHWWPEAITAYEAALALQSDNAEVRQRYKRLKRAKKTLEH